MGTEIDGGVANVIMAQLIHLESDSPDVEIGLYINSPGGSHTALMAIYDTMQFIRPNISTICMGQAASAAALLLAAGSPGRRFISNHARVLLHQPSGGSEGTISDLALQADEVMRVRSQVEEVISRYTGQSVETMRWDPDRDKIFNASDGLVDGILTHRPR